MAKTKKNPAASEAPTEKTRIASRGKRKPLLSMYKGRLSNPDETLDRYGKTGRDGCQRIHLYTLVRRQFPNVDGTMQAWVDHVLVTDSVIKAAKGENDEEQKIADAARDRMARAWDRMWTQAIATNAALWAKWYGFARCEIVPQFDDVLAEWIPILYDVPQDAWLFDDDGNEYLIKGNEWAGVEVDPARFAHFQWGSSDTKYGDGIASKCYISIWKMQQMIRLFETAIEDNNAPVALIGIPRSISDPDEREEVKKGCRDSYGNCVFYPVEGDKLVVDRDVAVSASGQTGRPELGGIEMHERWIQLEILGAPQTGNRMQGTGKVEDTRKEVWDDKTPVARTWLDQGLNASWVRTYCDWNLADVPARLRPFFKSDSPAVSQGLNGVAGQNVHAAALALAANQITDVVAMEEFIANGISPARAKAMVDDTVNKRSTLAEVPNTPKPAAPPQGADPSQQEAA